MAEPETETRPPETEVIERRPAARDVQEDSGLQALTDFIRKNKGADGCRVKVHRQTPHGREFCDSFLPEEIENAEEFLKQYHASQDYAHEPGVYFVSAVLNGETYSAFTIRIGPQKKSTSAPGVYSGIADYGLVSRLDRIEQRFSQEKTPMLEMVDGLAKLDQLRGGNGGGGFSLDNALKCIEIGTRMNGGGGSDGGWEGMLRDVLKDNAPAIIGLLQMGAAKLAAMTSKPPEPQAAAPPAQSPTVAPAISETADPSEQEKQILGGYIHYLKGRAAAHSDPGLYVDYIHDNREDPLNERLISKIVDLEFSEFAARFDPEIEKPEFREFFIFIHDRIRRIFKRASPVATTGGGKGGNKGNAGSNGTTGKSGG